MLIMIIKASNLFSCAVICKTNNFMRTTANLPTFKHILHNVSCTYKNYRKAKVVEHVEGNDVTAETNDEETNLSDKLIKWAIQNNISYLSFSKLLRVLSEMGVEGLPKNARDLLHAKEQETIVTSMAPGNYVHYGLAKNLTNLLLSLNSKNLLKKTDVDLSIFIDNLPTAKSTHSGLWLILGSVAGFPHSIFCVGVYHGYSKPRNSNLFLSQFVAEAKQLTKEGLTIDNVTYNISIKRLICDAPAKAFVLNIKDFKGYSSCTKCNAVGQYIRNTMCFQEKSTPKTDDDFTDDKMYQGVKTELLDIPNFGVVSNVPLDYMHLVCLGVVKKIMSIWLTDTEHWISLKDASEVVDTLLSLAPCEFLKKPKSIAKVNRWSAQNFRQFLLYYGPVALRNNLKKEYADHFLLLHVACRLLCMEVTPENIDRGRTLLNGFVESYKQLYKNEQITHNFHGLYHLADECASHGTLDSFSAFPFEEFLLKLRNTMEKSKKKLVPHTILKVASETVLTKSLGKLTTQTEPYKMQKKLKTDGDSQFTSYEKLSIKNFQIVPGQIGDNYVLLKDNKIVEVTDVIRKNEKTRRKTDLIAGREFSSVSNFHSEPYDKLKLDMYRVGKLSDKTEHWSVERINRKLMKIPVGKEILMVGLLDENF